MHEPTCMLASPFLYLHSGGSSVRKFWFLVVPAGLAAGVLLPYLVVRSDDIAERLGRETVAIAPEVEINSTEVRAQTLVLPKAARQPILKKDAYRSRKDGRYRARSRRSRMSRESQKKVQKEDQLAFRQAERFFRLEKSGRPE